MAYRLLIVDDNIHFADLIAVLLRQGGEADEEGWTSHHVGGLRAFQAAVAEEEFDLVLCDYRLKDAREQELFAFVARLNGTPPVAMMTGWMEPGLKDRATASGYVACLDKDEISTPGLPILLSGLLRAE